MKKKAETKEETREREGTQEVERGREEEEEEKGKEPWEIEDPVWTEFSQEYYEGAFSRLSFWRGGG